MAIYYYFPTIAMIAFITVFATIMSTGLGHPNAGVSRSFLLAVLAQASIFVVNLFLPSGGAFSVLLIGILQFYSIKFAFPADYLGTFYFFLFGLVFPAVFALVLAEPFADILGGFVY